MALRFLSASTAALALAAAGPLPAAVRVAPEAAAKVAPEAAGKVAPEAAAKVAPEAAAKVVPEAAGDESVPWLRVIEDEDLVALDVASRQFVRAAGGPRVGLVGVAHIGTSAFYHELQDHLAGYDVVLYESVLPPGANGAEGKDDLQRSTSTASAMRFVASLAETHRVRRHRYPETLADLQAFLVRRDSRLARWCGRAAVDAWGRDVEYRFDPGEDGATGPGRFSLTSLGADGQPGGDGADADIVVTSADRVEAMTLSGDENLQTQLAAALGLEFQLDAIDYHAPHWRCSDLAMDQIQVALAERGLEFGPFSDTLSGTSLPAKLVKYLLRFIRLADIFLDGAIADTCTVVLIETLGNEDMLEQSLSRMGEGFADVIVGERNQKVVDDLGRILESEPEVASVGIFYGAAHMRDFERRLEELGYAPSADHPVQWHRAMEVDLANSAMGQAELQQVREIVRQALQQQAR